MVKKLKKPIVWIAALAVIALAALFIMLPKGAGAEEVGSFTVTGGTKDTDYTYESGVLTIKTGTALTIKNTSSTSTTDTIFVESGVSANITLAGVNIDVSAEEDVCAFEIENYSTCNVTITLEKDSTNTLKSGKFCAGLQKKGAEGSLTINGSGKLTATGGAAAAGIGGGSGCNVSYITISGGTVTATGGDDGAGIGGGNGGYGMHITITDNAKVTATGGKEGAGIGGGDFGIGSQITISGNAVVKATGGKEGAGIGGGKDKNGFISKSRAAQLLKQQAVKKAQA